MPGEPWEDQARRAEVTLDSIRDTLLALKAQQQTLIKQQMSVEDFLDRISNAAEVTAKAAKVTAKATERTADTTWWIALPIWIAIAGIWIGGAIGIPFHR